MNINENQWFDVLLGKHGSRLRESSGDALRKAILESSSFMAVLQVASVQRGLAQKSSDELATFTLTKLNLGEYLVPTINIKNDWYKALSKQIADVTLKDVMLPQPRCIIRMVHDGIGYQAVVKQESPDHEIDTEFFTSAPEDESVPDDDDASDGRVDIFKRQLAYALLASEVDLAHSVSTRLDKREEGAVLPSLPGKADLNAYRGNTYTIVALRKNKGCQSSGEGTGTRKRFHVRRAHFRTYENGKTVRINWMFVGDINLGFVDKDYEV